MEQYTYYLPVLASNFISHPGGNGLLSAMVSQDTLGQELRIVDKGLHTTADTDY